MAAAVAAKLVAVGAEPAGRPAIKQQRGRLSLLQPPAVFPPPDYLDNPVTVRQQRQQGSLLLLPDSSAS